MTDWYPVLMIAAADKLIVIQSRTSPLKCGTAFRKERTSLPFAIKLIDGYPCKNNYMPVISAAVAGIF